MDIEIARSNKKMRKMFEKMAYNRVSTGDERKGKKKYLSESSMEGYGDQMEGMLKEANRRFGIKRFEDFSPAMFESIIQDLIDEFKKTGGKASSINTKISAIRAFHRGVAETNIYRTTKNRDDSHLLEFHQKYLDGLREKIKGDKVVRSGPKSTVLRATEEQALKVIENIQQGGYNTTNRKIVVDVAFLSLVTGGRVGSCLRMKAKDLDFENKTITMVKAKGGLTYYVDMRDKDIPLLKGILGSLKPNQQLFELKTKEGRIMSTEEGRKLVHRYVSEAGKEFAVDNKRFSTHSLRKAFARRNMEDYIDKIKTQTNVEAEVRRLSERDSKVAVKYESLYKRFNNYRIEKNEEIEKNNKKNLTSVEKLPLNEVSVKEAVIFFTSIQMGHFRNDVVSSYYSNYNEAVKSKSKH